MGPGGRTCPWRRPSWWGPRAVQEESGSQLFIQRVREELRGARVRTGSTCYTTRSSEEVLEGVGVGEVVFAGFAGEGGFIGGHADLVRMWGVVRTGAGSPSSSQEERIMGSPVPDQRTRSLSERPLGAVGEFSAGKVIQSCFLGGIC